MKDLSVKDAKINDFIVIRLLIISKIENDLKLEYYVYWRTRLWQASWKTRFFS